MRTLDACIALALLCAGIVVPPAVLADEPLDVGELTRRSDVVFRGVVEEIEYVLSQPARAGGPRLPHTFVTYRVVELLRGEVPGGTVTLRFLGGLDERTGLYMGTSRSPQFDVGDDDILFVAGNCRRACPLVGESGGRLRVIGGRTYSETGREVLLDEKSGALRIGRRHKLEEVETTDVGGRRVRTFDDPEAEAPTAASIGGEVAEAVTERIAKTARGLDRPGAFASADPRKPFAGPETAARTPPRDRGRKPGEKPDAATGGTRPPKRD